MDRHVEELRSAIKLVQGSLTPAMRQKIMCIITIDTHGRDVIQRLLTENASAVDCFQWQSQLKYFWDAEKVGNGARATRSSEPPCRAHRKRPKGVPPAKGRSKTFAFSLLCEQRGEKLCVLPLYLAVHAGRRGYSYH